MTGALLTSCKICSKWKWATGFPESTAWDDNSQCPDSLLGNVIPGSRKAGCRGWSREESKACTEKHYQVAQSSGQPVFYFAGTSEEPHEICLRTDHTRGKTRKNFPLTPLYHLLRVPFSPQALYCTCVLMDIPHCRDEEAQGRSQEMHAQVQVRWLSDWHCIKLAETCTELAVQTEVGIRECQVGESIMSRYLIQPVLVSNKCPQSKNNSFSL